MTRIKIVMLGSAFVGKTSIVSRYVNGTFKEITENTLGAAFVNNRIMINNEIVNLEIWDTAGSERFRSIVKMYYRNGDIMFIVYDASNKKSFEECKHWVNVVQDALYDPYIVIICNKIDICSDDFGGEEYAKSNNFKFKKVSAKTGKNIENLFLDICREYVSENKIQYDIIEATLSLNKIYNVKDNDNIKRCGCI